MVDAKAALSLIVGLCCLCCLAQPPLTAPGMGEIEAIVNNIDSHLKQLKKSSVMLQTGTDRGGEATIYRRDSDVVRIDATVSGSRSDVQDRFYYSGNKLIFVKTKTVTYPYSSTLNRFNFSAPKEKAAAEYYVRDGKLVPVRPATVAASATSALLKEAELFLTAVRRGDQVIDIEKLVK